MQQKKYRLIIKRRLFKFRRKKSLNQSKNFNNNHITIQQTPPKNSIEQILNHQWIQIFDQRKSHENYSYSIDSINPTTSNDFSTKSLFYPGKNKRSLF